MYRGSQNQIVPISFSEAILDNDDIVGGYGDANPVSIDTQGFAHCLIFVYVGTTDIAMTALRVMEGASVAVGADDSDFTEVTGLVAAGSTGDGRLPTASDDDSVFVFDVKTEGRSRYLCLDATAGNGTAGSWIHAFALLFNGDEEPFSASDKGAVWVLAK